MQKEMYQLFRDYKEEEGKKILQIIHACTAISSAALISEGMAHNSGFLVLSIFTNALTYAYWYFADTGVFRMNEMLLTNSKANADIRKYQEDNDKQEELKLYQATCNWSYLQFNEYHKYQINFQIKCFLFSLMSWFFAIIGLTFIYVLDSIIIDSRILAIIITIAIIIGVILVGWDYSKIIKMNLAEPPATH